MPILGKTIGSGVLGGVGGAAVGAGIGSVVPGAGTAAGSTTGAIIGSRTAASYSMFELEAGLMRSELKQEQDELGNALPDDLIKGASIVTGLINAGLEYFGFASVAKTFGAGKVTGKIIRGKIKDLVKDEGVRPLLIKIGKDYAKGVITESTTEAMQEIVNIVSSDIAKSMSGQAFEKTPTAKKVERVVNSAVDAALATGVISGVGSTGRTIQIMKKQGMSNNEANTKAANMSPVEKKVFLEENTDTLQEVVKEDLSKLSQESNIAEMQLSDTDSETLRAFEPIQELLEEKEKLSQADFEKIKPDITDVSAEAAKSLTKYAARKADIETFVSDLKDAKEVLSRSIKDGKIETKELNKLEKLANKRSPDSINFEKVTFDILSQATGLPVAQIKSAITRGKTDKIDTLLEKVEDQIEEIFPEWTEFYGYIDLSELNAGHNLAQEAWRVALSEYPLQKNKFKTQADIRYMQEIERFKELSDQEALDRKSVEESLNNYINSINKAIPRIQQQIIKQAPKDIVRLTDKAIDRITSAFKKGIQEGRKLTKEQINLYQKILTDYINNQPIDSTEKAQFLNKVKNVQTETNLTKTIESIESSIKRVNEIKENRILRKQINKLIKEKVIIKDGALRKAKFDFETTQIFKEIKALSKLTQEQAKNKILELQLEGIEPKTFEEKLINKLLTYKAMGAKSDIALLKSLKEDLEKLKKEGIEAKNENELEKKLNKNNAISEITEVLLPYEKGSGVVQWLLDRYNANVANIYSLFNAFGGKAFAENTTNLQQSKLSSAIFFKNKEVIDKAVKIFGLKDRYRLNEIIVEMGKLNNEYILKKDGIPRKLNTFELMDIYNALKNDDIAQDYFDTYGQENILNLMDKLTPEQMEMADLMAEIVRGYEQVLSEYSIKKFGLPLAKRANYWPATSEHMPDEYNALQNYIPKTQIPSALKIKVTHTTPIPKNAWLKMQKHINHAEYINHMADTYETLNNMFSDSTVKNLITEKLGHKTLNQIQNELEYMSLAGKIQAQNQFIRTMEKLLAGWTVAKVASIPVFTKQLISTINYTTAMPISVWNKYFMEGIKNPKKTIEYMINEIDYLKSRFGSGYDDAISAAIREAEKMSSTSQKIMEAASSFTRTGDIGAVVFGGYPYYKYLLETGMSKEEAINRFIQRTEKTMQGKESSNLSSLQKQSGLNFFSRFLNTPNQYLRLIVDTQIQYKRGEVSQAEYNKTIAMYLFIQPVMFSLLGSAFASLGKAARGEEDDLAEYFWEAMNQVLIVPFEAIPVLNGLVNWALRSAENLETYDPFALQMFNDWGRSVTGIKSSLKNQNIAGVLYHSGILMEAQTKIPVKNIVNFIDLFAQGQIKSAVSNKKKKKAKYL